MGRKKKLVNNSIYPQHLIERFARCVIEDIRADFAKAEVQAEFKRWVEEQEKRAAENGCSVCLCGFLFAWAPVFGVWTNWDTVREVLLIVSCEINKQSEPTWKSWLGLYCFGTADWARFDQCSARSSPRRRRSSAPHVDLFEPGYVIEIQKERLWPLFLYLVHFCNLRSNRYC